MFIFSYTCRMETFSLAETLSKKGVKTVKFGEERATVQGATSGDSSSNGRPRPRPKTAPGRLGARGSNSVMRANQRKSWSAPPKKVSKKSVFTFKLSSQDSNFLVQWTFALRDQAESFFRDTNSNFDINFSKCFYR